jgi:hypothetical protein
VTNLEPTPIPTDALMFTKIIKITQIEFSIISNTSEVMCILTVYAV